MTPTHPPAQASDEQAALSKQLTIWRAEVARLNDLIAHASGVQASDEPMRAAARAFVILANQCGIDTDTDGDIWGSTNGALLVFARAVRAAALDEAAALFPQPYMEYFGSDIQESITALEAQPAPVTPMDQETLDEKALNALLWFYRRAENAYGRLPFAEEAIAGLRARIAQPAPTEAQGMTAADIEEVAQAIADRVKAIQQAQGEDSARLDAQVTAAARVLANRSADACGVNRDDNWKVYSQDFIDDARAALEAARASAETGGVKS